MRSTILITLVLGGCSGIGGPTLDELNAVTAVPDPRVDDIPAEAPFAPAQQRDVGDADAVFVAPVSNEFVSGVVMPGDLDGDGYDDLVLWSDRSNSPDIVDCTLGCPGFSQLVVYVDYGGPQFAADGAITPDASIEGWHINGLHHWVAPGGDVDGDGRPDVLISIAGECQQGNVFTLYGGARLTGTIDVRDLSAPIRESGSCTGFGTAAGVGDLDDDGFGDFAITARATGRTFLFYGRADRALDPRDETAADVVLIAWTPGTDRSPPEGALGPGQPAGDVDGDGDDDLLLAPRPNGSYQEPRGAWFLLRGGERLHGEVEIDDLSTHIDAARVSGLGDLDGDGDAELGVTLHSLELDGYVIAGRAEWPGVMDVEDGVLGIQRAAGMGTGTLGTTMLRPAGDVDGNGELDFLYADAAATEDEIPRGSVHLFLGPKSLDAQALSLDEGTAFLGQLWLSDYDGVLRGYDELGGWSWLLGDGIAAGSDLDGDGLDDIAILARLAPDYGRVYVWRGRR